MKGWVRSAARIDPDARARQGLMVPQMAPSNGLGCDWHCTPEATNAECLIHAPIYR